ncbi:class I SAM-dependent methyltransferase [Flavihumibacter petaseus]|uniref:Putative methyltransferase n=1 Tax=Flavihumibacter petaseus NBRC 106054 TaxID=1220578 RepID=A0A0E9MY21_9BACT|nr:class I SAM-dependent methyltransferase [Flavihumibacter petaseus]GAO42388.1 putative methyltransferase [Flavihumibacter petaseus NBRC 106054]
MNEEKEILDSWHVNAAAWTNAIAANSIESRKLVTNQAIIDAIAANRPGSLLDLGCGEGWLLRAVSAVLPATRLYGLDAIPALAEQAARNCPSARVGAAAYQDIVDGRTQPESTGYALIVFNFSLFGKELAEALFSTLRNNWLQPSGAIMIQTLHPFNAGASVPYEEGWLPGNWKGFSKDFTQPAPWYFRTIGSWLKLFKNTDFYLESAAEPLHPDTLQPLSIIFTLKPRV